MITTEIEELHEQLSRYLSLVKNGEDVVVTEHGTVVARITHEIRPMPPLRRELLPLIQRGLVRYPERDIDREIPEPIKLPGKPVSEMILEDRR